MHKNYTDKTITDKFASDKAIIDSWATVELAVLKAQADQGLVTQEQYETAARVQPPTPAMVDVALGHTQHEVAAFLTAWPAKVHIGVTSSDIVDTATSYRLMQVEDHILNLQRNTLACVAQLALRTWGTDMVGRTHGQPAISGKLGHRFGSHLFMLARRHYTTIDAFDVALVATISGAIGNHSHPTVSATVEGNTAFALGLGTEPMATQIIARDRWAELAQSLALWATACEALATQIRLLALTGEAQEGHRAGYVGSSAMPHKSNPIRSERITGLARLARSNANAIVEGVSQWHDRDLAHSSVERVALPDLLHLTCTISKLTAETAHSLIVHQPQGLEQLGTPAYLQQIHNQLQGAHWRNSRIGTPQLGHQQLDYKDQDRHLRAIRQWADPTGETHE
jgi:adenylosuccinate lyase